MFYVFNKSKIYSYLIALCTVVILFVAATTINDMASPSGNIIETSTNIIEKDNISENTVKQEDENIIRSNTEKENKVNK